MTQQYRVKISQETGPSLKNKLFDSLEEAERFMSGYPLKQYEKISLHQMTDEGWEEKEVQYWNQKEG